MMHKHVAGGGNIYKFEYCPICGGIPETEWAEDPPRETAMGEKYDPQLKTVRELYLENPEKYGYIYNGQPKTAREMLNEISDLDYERGRERGRFEGACLVMIGTLIMLAIMFLVRHVGAT